MTSVAAAYLQRNQRPAVSGLVVHPPGVVFQKPFSTGETEIAGYQSDVLERRLANQGQPRAGDRRADARPAHLPEGAADAGVEGRRRQRRRPDLRRVLPPRRRHGLDDAGQRPRRPHLRLGHHRGAERHLRGANRRQRLAVASRTAARWSASSESAVIEVDNTPPAVTAGPVARGRRPGRRSPSRSATTSRRCREWSTRSTAQRWLPAYPARRPARRPARVGDPAARGPRRPGKTLVVRATDALHNVGSTTVTLR